jgi:putative hydrolase of the HAD superfamily
MHIGHEHHPVKVNGIFFDLYGTLLVYGDMASAWQIWLDSLHTCFQDAGLAADRQTFAELCDGFLGRPEPPVVADGLTVYERRLKALSCELGVTMTSGTLRRAAAASAGAWQRYVTLDPEARPVLRALASDKQLALVSNFDHPPHLHEVLARYGLSHLFQSIVVSAEVGVKKPDPGIFTAALAKTMLLPQQVAYVGDSDEDIEAARNGGLVPIRIRRPGSDSGDGADFKVNAGASQVSCQADARTISRLSELVTLCHLK